MFCQKKKNEQNCYLYSASDLTEVLPQQNQDHVGALPGSDEAFGIRHDHPCDNTPILPHWVKNNHIPTRAHTGSATWQTRLQSEDFMCILTLLASEPHAVLQTPCSSTWPNLIPSVHPHSTAPPGLPISGVAPSSMWEIPRKHPGNCLPPSSPSSVFGKQTLSILST